MLKVHELAIGMHLVGDWEEGLWEGKNLRANVEVEFRWDDVNDRLVVSRIIPPPMKRWTREVKVAGAPKSYNLRPRHGGKVFKNHGSSAGASTSHSHTQIGAATCAFQIWTIPRYHSPHFHHLDEEKDVVNTICEDDIQPVSFSAARTSYSEGRSHIVVMPDADMDVVLNALVSAAFRADGERCFAFNTVTFVGHSKPWETELVKRTQALQVNAGTEPNVDIGPMLSKQEKEKLCKSIQSGIDSGARPILDGRNIMVSSSQEDGFIVAPVDNSQRHQEDTMVSQASDDTQDPAEDEHHLSRVKEWIISSHLDAVEVTDMLANFPDISVVLTEEIMEKLVLEGFLSKTGKDTFAVVKQKEMEYEFNVKEEIDDQVPVNDAKAAPGSGEDYMYMKALYHALPMDYITLAKIQRNLEGKANQTTVRKLIDRMTKDGFVEATSNRKLGKQVIHSEVTDKKLSEVRKALDMDEMDVEVNPSQNNMNQSASVNPGNKTNLSTCGVLHSIGSDLTSMRVRSESEINQNGSLRTDQSISTAREGLNTQTSKTKGRPIASRESMIPGNGNTRSNGNSANCNEVDDVTCCRMSQDKRSRKSSTVKSNSGQSKADIKLF